MDTKSRLFSAVSPEEARNLERAMNVGGNASYPYKLFSPFTFSQQFRVPVPGQEGMFSFSVENIWQGLKIIDGLPDFSLFTLEPKKRKGHVQGHLFKKDILGYIDARKEIFQPAYFYYLDKHVSLELKEEVVNKGLNGGLAFFDIIKNVEITNPSTPLAHSYFVALYFNEYLEEKKRAVENEIDQRYFASESRHETLADPLARSLKFYSESSSLQKSLIKFFLRSSHEDVDFYQKRYYSSLLGKIEQLYSERPK